MTAELKTMSKTNPWILSLNSKCQTRRNWTKYELFGKKTVTRKPFAKKTKIYKIRINKYCNFEVSERSPVASYNVHAQVRLSWAMYNTVGLHRSRDVTGSRGVGGARGGRPPRPGDPREEAAAGKSALRPWGQEEGVVWFRDVGKRWLDYFI